MATPLDPAPSKYIPRLTETPTGTRQAGRDWSRNVRNAFNAALGILILAAAVVATPAAAQAQDDEMTSANAWVTDQIQAPGAWETTRGAGVTVAVIDSGISEHPFFEGKSVEPGYSVFSGEDDAWNDQDGHGTNVAAMVLLAAPEATILPVRSGTGYDPQNDGLTGGAEGGQVESIRWAVDNGADVLVMSWGIDGTEPSQEFLDAMQYAVDSGVVAVSAMGNDPEGEPGYPPNIPGVVAVSGTDESGGLWTQSTTGPESVVAAPSSDMMTLNVQDESLGWGDDTDQELYANSSGTSLGTGIAGGAVALVLGADSELDGNNAINRLIQTAGDGSGENRTDTLGFGLINADGAVNSDDIESVDENPLGYPLGEPGESGVDPEAEGEDAEGGSDAGEPSAGASANSESGLSTIIVIAAAVVLVGAAIAVWLVLRGRGRKAAAANAGQQAAFVPAGDPNQGGYQQPGPVQQKYGPPMTGGSGYQGPPTGGHQGYNPPTNPGEPSPPWGPSDPNRR